MRPRISSFAALVLLVACGPVALDEPRAPDSRGDDDEVADDDDAVDDDDAPVGPRLSWTWTEQPAAVHPGCESAGDLRLENVGDEVVRLGEVFIEDRSDAGEFELSPPVVAELSPGARVDLRVAYRPADVGEDRAYVVVESNDIDEPVLSIEVVASTSVERLRLEVVVPARQRTELLFVIDSSACSNLEQTALAELVPALLDRLDDDGVDWQAAVTTADTNDGGDFVGGAFLTAAHASPGPVLAERIQVGGNGWGVETGFDGARLALHPERVGPGGDHEAFIRDGAGLRILFLSDEAEQSTLLPSVAAYADAFAEAVGHPRRLRAYDLSGGLQGCSGETSSGGYGGDYVAMSTLTGGTSALICDSSAYGALLGALGDDAATPPDTVPLGVEPAPGTLGVTYVGNAGEVEPAWTWDETWRTVLLDEATLPSPGDLVRLDYWPAGVCD